MNIYDCRECGQQLHTRTVRSKAMRPGRITSAADRDVDMPVPCQNPSCPRYRMPIVGGQAVSRPE